MRPLFTFRHLYFVLSLNCAKIKFMGSNQNSIQGRGAARKLSRSPKHQEFKSSPRKDPKRLPRSLSHQGNHKMSKWLKGSNIQIAKRSMLSELLRDSNCQEVKIAKRSYMSRIQRSKRPMLSKLPRDPNVQELPREVHVVRSWAFPHNRIYLYCKRPTIRADEPSIVKANLVQAYKQKKGPSHTIKHVMKVSVTCQFCALILHHSRNSPW